MQMLWQDHTRTEDWYKACWASLSKAVRHVLGSDVMVQRDGTTTGKYCEQNKYKLPLIYTWWCPQKLRGCENNAPKSIIIAFT